MLQKMTQQYPQSDFLEYVHVPRNPGTYFLGRKKRLRQDAWEYGTFKRGWEMMELFYFLRKIDSGGCGDGFGVLRDR